MAVARRDEGGLKPVRMEVEQSRKRFLPRDAPDFVEVGEAGIAVSDAMRHQLSP